MDASSEREGHRQTDRTVLDSKQIEGFGVHEIGVKMITRMLFPLIPFKFSLLKSIPEELISVISASPLHQNILGE